MGYMRRNEKRRETYAASALPPSLQEKELQPVAANAKNEKRRCLAGLIATNTVRSLAVKRGTDRKKRKSERVQGCGRRCYKSSTIVLVRRMTKPERWVEQIADVPSLEVLDTGRQKW
jgi:dihydroorotate dehydrogenase